MKKSKILLSGVAAATTLASIAPLSALASCGNNDDEVAFEAKYDEEYGVDEFTYNTVEKQFQKLATEKIDTDDSLTPEEKVYEKEKLSSDLTNFRSQISTIQENPNVAKSTYTTISNALIDHAQEEYGIRLNRNTKAQWSDIEQMYNGLKNSWKAYLQATGITGDKLNGIMDDVETNYKKMTTSLTEKYVDPLSALIKAKMELPVIFSAVNTNIAYLAAGTILKQFLSSYTFEYNTERTNNKLDQLETLAPRHDEELGQVEFKVDNDITAYMNDIFVVRNAKTGQKVPEGFTRNIIPGWKISPILTNISHDEYTNDHCISISWQCVKDTFKLGSEEAKKATAYGFNFDRDRLSDYFNNTPAEQQSIEGFSEANKDSRSTIVYSIPVTTQTEQINLEKTFQATEKDEYDTTGNVRIFWKDGEDKFIDALELGEEIFKNDDDYRYFRIAGSHLAESGAKVDISSSTNEGESEYYSLNDLYTNATKAVKVGDDETTFRINKLPYVIRGLGDGCDVSAVAKISKKDATDVSFEDAKIVYKNSTGEASINLEIEKPTGPWQTSELGWKQIIDKYNGQRQLYEQYEYNIFQKDKEAIDKEKTLNDVMISITSIFDGLIILSCLIPSKTVGEQLMATIYLNLSLIDLGIEAVSYYIFRIYKYDIVSDYAKRVKEVKDTPAYHAFANQLSEDKQKYDLLDASDAATPGDLTNKMNISQSDFDDHYKIWKNHPEWYLECQDKYINSSFKNPVLQSFKTMLSDHNLDMEGYKAKMADWDDGGKWQIISKSLMWSSLALLIAQLVLGWFDAGIVAAVNAKYPIKAAADTTKQLSLNFFKRAWRAWKKLLGEEVKETEKIVQKANEIAEPVHETIQSVQVVNKNGKIIKTAEEEANYLEKSLKTIPDGTRNIKITYSTGRKEVRPDYFLELKDMGRGGRCRSGADVIHEISKCNLDLDNLVDAGLGIDSKLGAIATVFENTCNRLVREGKVLVKNVDKVGNVTYTLRALEKNEDIIKITGAVVSKSKTTFKEMLDHFEKSIDYFVSEAAKLAQKAKGFPKGSPEYKEAMVAAEKAISSGEEICQKTLDTIKGLAHGSTLSRKFAYIETVDNIAIAKNTTLFVTFTK